MIRSCFLFMQCSFFDKSLVVERYREKIQIRLDNFTAFANTNSLVAGSLHVRFAREPCEEACPVQSH